MKYIKAFALVLAVYLIAYLIIVAIQKDSLVLAGTLVVLFLVLTYLGFDLKVKSFKLDGNTLEVNEKESGSESKN